MYLVEEIETINRQLREHYGSDIVTNQSIWRVVWSDDQYEKRLTDCTDSGVKLLIPEVRLLPKYKQWIPSKWVLERLVIVPEINAEELPAAKTSYEPLHIFETQSGEYLPPKFNVAKYVVDCVYAAQGKASMAKYKDPEAGLSKEDWYAKKNAELDELQKDMFGNETMTGDALAHKQAIVVPRNYGDES